MGKKVKTGDVFKIDINDDSVCIGQVVSMWKSELYVVLFEEVFPCDHLPDMSEIEKLTPYLASSTLDAKLWHGHWIILGNQLTNLGFIKQPSYKIQENSDWIVESFDRETRRVANYEELDSLKYRKCVAPIRLEKAFRAYVGEDDWDSIYDELKYDDI